MSDMTYLDGQRMVKYWREMVFHIVGRMVLNSNILKLYTEKLALNTSHLLLRAIEKEWLAEKNPANANKVLPTGDTDNYGVRKLPGKKKGIL